MGRPRGRTPAGPSADRINYEILDNSEPELHAHVFPRYSTEPPDMRRLAGWFYDWAAAPRYDALTHASLRDALRTALLGCARRVSRVLQPRGYHFEFRGAPSSCSEE